MVDPLSRRLITCGVTLVVMGMPLEDQLSNVSNIQLVAFMGRLTVSLTILESTRLAQDRDELPDQWLSRKHHARLSTNVDGLILIRGKLYVSEILTHSGLRQ